LISTGIFTLGRRSSREPFSEHLSAKALNHSHNQWKRGPHQLPSKLASHKRTGRGLLLIVNNFVAGSPPHDNSNEQGGYTSGLRMHPHSLGDVHSATNGRELFRNRPRKISNHLEYLTLKRLNLLSEGMARLVDLLPNRFR
jgi:hypothetical protein